MNVLFLMRLLKASFAPHLLGLWLDHLPKSPGNPSTAGQRAEGSAPISFIETTISFIPKISKKDYFRGLIFSSSHFVASSKGAM